MESQFNILKGPHIVQTENFQLFYKTMLKLLS